MREGCSLLAASRPRLRSIHATRAASCLLAFGRPAVSSRRLSRRPSATERGIKLILQLESARSRPKAETGQRPAARQARPAITLQVDYKTCSNSVPHCHSDSVSTVPEDFCASPPSRGAERKGGSRGLEHGCSITAIQVGAAWLSELPASGPARRSSERADGKSRAAALVHL